LLVLILLVKLSQNLVGNKQGGGGVEGWEGGGVRDLTGESYLGFYDS